MEDKIQNRLLYELSILGQKPDPNEKHDELIETLTNIVKERGRLMITASHYNQLDDKTYDDHTNNIAMSLLAEVKQDLVGIVNDCVSDEEKVNQLRQFCEPYWTLSKAPKIMR